MLAKMLDLMPPGQERGHGKIHHHCYPNLFSLNHPSMAAVRRCNLLHHPLSKYQNLKDVARYHENGEVIVNLQLIFDGAFANVKIKTISKQVSEVHQRKIKLWEARRTHFFRGYQMDIVAGYTPTNPSCNITLKDNSTLYYKKTSTIMALLWYNLTQGADAQWRKRWFCHLLGSESSVLLWQSLFDNKDAVVHLSVHQNTKTNKKKYVFCYPNDNK
jgi:hypothetical protein